jgi:cell division protein FtsB
MQDLDYLRREMGKLQAENDELKKRVEPIEHRPSQPDSATPKKLQIVSGATQPQLGVVTHYRDIEEFRQAVTRKFEQVERERDALQKENEELKKQIEKLKDARSQTNEAASEHPLQPALPDPR